MIYQSFKEEFVKKIIDYRVDSTGKSLWQVLWESNEKTWEPKSSFVGDNGVCTAYQQFEATRTKKVTTTINAYYRSPED